MLTTTWNLVSYHPQQLPPSPSRYAENAVRGPKLAGSRHPKSKAYRAGSNPLHPNICACLFQAHQPGAVGLEPKLGPSTLHKLPERRDRLRSLM